MPSCTRWGLGEPYRGRGRSARSCSSSTRPRSPARPRLETGWVWWTWEATVGVGGPLSSAQHRNSSTRPGSSRPPPTWATPRRAADLRDDPCRAGSLGAFQANVAIPPCVNHCFAVCSRQCRINRATRLRLNALPCSRRSRVQTCPSRAAVSDAFRQITMRSISSTVTLSAVRS